MVLTVINFHLNLRFSFHILSCLYSLTGSIYSLSAPVASPSNYSTALALGAHRHCPRHLFGGRGDDNCSIGTDTLQISRPFPHRLDMLHGNFLFFREVSRRHSHQCHLSAQQQGSGQVGVHLENEFNTHSITLLKVFKLHVVRVCTRTSKNYSPKRLPVSLMPDNSLSCQGCARLWSQIHTGYGLYLRGFFTVPSNSNPRTLWIAPIAAKSS